MYLPKKVNSVVKAVLISVIVTLISCSLAFARDKRLKQLAPRYKKWLTHDVVWIISKTEKEVFLSLKTDAQRDRFIDMFWKSRDPTPGTPRNEYKEEIYRRIQYANSHFSEGTGPGWQTDRGRIYIQLGPPAQVYEWEHEYQLYPVKLWFYSMRNHPTLPNFFYLVFWQREGAGGYVLYSPYNDGPEKLVHATFGGRRQSWEYIKSINGDLARAVLTYLPTEPIDIDTLRPSLRSDVLVANIFSLPEKEAPLQYLQAFLSPNSKLREKVYTRYNFQFTPTKAVFLPVSDPKGNTLLHYAFYISPEDLSIAQYKGEYYAALDVSIDISNMKGKSLLHHTRKVVRYFSPSEFKRVQNHPLVFKDKLGVVPGKYMIDLMILNKITNQTYRYHKVVTIADSPPIVPQISQLVMVDRFYPVKQTYQSLDNLAFTFSNYTFQPLIKNTLRPVEYLNILYQLYYPPDKARKEASELLTIEYKIANKKNISKIRTIIDHIPKGKFSAAGTLLNFKQIPLKDLTPGDYSLIVTVKEPSRRAIVSTHNNFILDPSIVRQPPILIASKTLRTDSSGVYDFDRGTILLKEGKKEKALKELEQAVLKSPHLTKAVVILARLQLANGMALKAVQNLKRVLSNKDFTLNNRLLFTKCLLAAGLKQEALDSLNGILKQYHPTIKQYKLISELYKHLGKNDKAGQIEKIVSGGVTKKSDK